jgi:hypothetical protein
VLLIQIPFPAITFTERFPMYSKNLEKLVFASAVTTKEMLHFVYSELLAIDYGTPE